MIITGICRSCGMFVEIETTIPNTALEAHFGGKVDFYCSNCTQGRKWERVIPGGLRRVQ